MELFLSTFKGFLTSFGLIIAIGAQNAFVIRQGILGHHIFFTALGCSLLDASLICLGVLGFGTMIAKIPGLLLWSKIFAIGYLIIYGFLSFRSAFNKKDALSFGKLASTCLKKTLIILLAVTLLNPHAYLDTVILLGSIAAQEQKGLKLFFTLGAIAASFLWFFALTYGSAILSPWLKTNSSLKILDIIVATIMWGIAGTLAMST